MATTRTVLNKRKALEKIHEHNRDFLKMDVTLPLGNKALKKVHTNQFLFTDLPKEFDLENWGVIAEALNATENRYVPYVKNRWYIEAVDIHVEEGGKAEMKISSNAFPSSFSSYSELSRNIQNAYTDAMKKTDSNKTTKSSATKKKSNATTKNAGKIKNGWWGKWVTNLANKTVGNETDVLKRCKKMHELFRWHVVYSGYNDMPKTGGSVKKLEKVWKGTPKLNCGDGANYLSAFYSACGAKTGIYLSSDSAHYTVKCQIGKKTYWCDQSGGTGKHNTLRGFGKTFNNYKGGSYYGKYV